MQDQPTADPAVEESGSGEARPPSATTGPRYATHRIDVAVLIVALAVEGIDAMAQFSARDR